MVPLLSKRQNITDFGYLMDPSTKSQQNAKMQAEFAEFSDFDTSPRPWYEESFPQPRLSSMAATATPTPFEFYDTTVPNLSASASSASIAASGLMSDFPRRFSSANSSHAMTACTSLASFGGYYGGVPAYGGDFSSPLSPFTTADDTNIIDELFDQDMGLMLDTTSSPSMIQSDEIGSTMQRGVLQPASSFGQFRKGSWHGQASLDILEEVGSQIDATSYVEPDAKSSAETCGSPRSFGLDEQQPVQEIDDGMGFDEIDDESGMQKLLSLDDFLLADFQPSPDLLVAPFLSSSNYDVQSQTGPLQFGEASTTDAFDLGFPNAQQALASYAPGTSSMNAGGQVNYYSPLQSMAWSVKEQTPPPTLEQHLQQAENDDDALGGIEMLAAVDVDNADHAPVVANDAKPKSCRRKRSVDSDSSWVVKENELDTEAGVKKSSKIAGKARSGKSPTSRVISPRKRVQNRDAAQRYRQRKKDEEKNAEHSIEELENQYDSLYAERQNFRQELEILRSLLRK